MNIFSVELGLKLGLEQNTTGVGAPNLYGDYAGSLIFWFGVGGVGATIPAPTALWRLTKRPTMLGALGGTKFFLN